MLLFDMHCHYVPGVDDGADNYDTALDLIELEYDAGIKNIIITPHFRPGMFTAPRDVVKRRFLKLKQMAEEYYPDLKLYLGCEFHAHVNQLETLEQESDYTMPNQNFILLEFSHNHLGSFIKSKTSELINAGYEVVIAHIERYEPVRKHPELLEQLKEMGAYFQVNAGSILGKEGCAQKSFCKKLMKKGYVDFVGSDGHNLKNRRPCLSECIDKISRKYGDDVVQKIFCDNPLKLIES